MILYDKSEQLPEFIHFIATKKRNLKDMCYLHIAYKRESKSDIFSEIIQFLGFELQKGEAVLYKHDDPQELVLVGDSDCKSSIINIEQKIYSNFPSDLIRASMGDFSEQDMEKFRNIMINYVTGHAIAELGLKRLCRLSNSVLVLDDDVMITKQIEKALQGFGRVFTLNSHKQFIETYREHAPNVLFLDIHLGQVRGPHILDMFFEKVDPYAHVIIISSDTGEKTIKEVKERGAHGFVVKPFNRQKLLDQIVGCPTFYAKHTVKA